MLETSNGHWKYTLLHAFNGSDGSGPTANLTLGPDGKLYGTAAIAPGRMPAATNQVRDVSVFVVIEQPR